MQFYKNSGSSTLAKQLLQNHLLLISQTIQVRKTKLARHVISSKNELMSNVMSLTPTHRYTSADWSAKTWYTSLLCGHWMQSRGNSRNRCREYVKVLRDISMTWFKRWIAALARKIRWVNITIQIKWWQ